ncbi:hypothetical protein CEY15_02275 [Dietzia natronolimnaea]|uniref:Helix-turn-helix domain-containing protein n=1 Tax=Dietzia natronolimnaea TaxID=161920 RepID=A0A2A2WUC3_9ACTN|nr:helix-turn-helix domain-containing protein [Dietzia natronolimnaea]PAY24643.1 hypothetical protein CEY15_02275 [Dietzia natronolimnaea]
MSTPRIGRPASISEAADRYGVNPVTIRRWISSGRISGFRFGPRMIRVDLDEIDALARPLAAGGASA